jgi:hypothetical protein
MHRERLLLVGLGSVTVALFLVLWHATRLAPDTVAPPQSLQDVALRADVLGLHHRSDVLSGKVGDRLVVSDQALTFDRVSALRFGEIAHPCWQGTVAACVPWRSYLNYAHPDHGVVWGRTFLFGDPAIIRALTSAKPVPGKEKAGAPSGNPILAAGCWGVVTM